MASSGKVPALSQSPAEALLFLHQEVDEGSAWRQKSLLDGAALQVLGSKLALEHEPVDLLAIASCLLRHRNLATGFVIDLKDTDKSKQQLLD